jgi:carbonic anhydrase
MKRGLVVTAVVVVSAVVLEVFLTVSPRSQFVMGGALVNAGFRLQDPLHAFNFEKPHLTAQEVWEEFQQQNSLAASVRKHFPRSTEHPMVALLVCMDARIDTSELAGDTRHYYYVIRTAGSVLGDEEQEMLELAVRSGVKVLVLTRHTDCAAEAVAADPVKRAQFPKLSAAVDVRSAHVEAFLARPYIAEQIASGELLVEQLFIDTRTDQLLTNEAAAALQ